MRPPEAINLLQLTHTLAESPIRELGMKFKNANTLWPYIFDRHRTMGSQVFQLSNNLEADVVFTVHRTSTAVEAL